MRLPPEPQKRARIEIVPMIDAIFFLLVFFMVSSLSMVKLNGLNAALPQTPHGGTSGGSGTGAPGAATPRADAPHLMVEVRTSGPTTVGGTAVSDDPKVFAQTVAARLRARPGSVVVLRAEPGSAMQKLVATLDALNDVRLPSGARPTVLIATPKVATRTTESGTNGTTP